MDVDIKHTFRGDVVVDLVAPDGSTYRLKNSSTSDSADNILATYTVNASSEVANGTWRLKAQDTYRSDTGYIDGWKLSF
ncbi:proprotein convertase P-domain-containing protein [Actinokineospora auranticolor]|uniref:proprotein convertase P-domain-containing protein n=1 Tax=Actinokineospora auranticolor TaxID=155976 RepID=UPI002481F1C1|nr:proprotein convertase P-domain-containing protein [Actinokineospora auranticolor]